MEEYNQKAEQAKQNGKLMLLTREEIKEVKKHASIVESSVHPDTKQIIPAYMKMSGYMPLNIPLLFGLLFVKKQSPLFNATVQWLNQTYNAGLNYGNRNASSDYTLVDLGRGYIGAVIVSVSIAVGLRIKLAQQILRLNGAKLILANAFLGYIPVSLAGASNLILMRAKELNQGINIQNEDGSITYGKSKVAARQAIMYTALSRFVLPIPALFFPAIGNLVLEQLRLWPKGNLQAKILEFFLCVGSLTLAMPLSVALFQQRIKIESRNLEIQFQEQKEIKDGQKITYFYFNKGL